MSKLVIGALALLLAGACAKKPAVIQFFNPEGGQLAEVRTRYLGDATVVRIGGLSPNAPYVVRASVGGLGGKALEAKVTIVADAAGVIQTDTTGAVDGTYSGVEADGLFWSMRPSDAVGQSPYEYRVTVEDAGAVVAGAVLRNAYLKPGITRIDLAGTGLVGALYLPAQAAPLPAVIAFGGSEGGSLDGEEMAMALANRGYAGLGLAYFNAPGLPDDLAKIPLEYFRGAITYLAARPEIDARKLALSGISRGGELALLLGATYPEIKAVIGRAPSPYRWGGNGGNTDPANAPAAWTVGGQALAFLGVTGELVPTTLPDGRTAYDNAPLFASTLSTAGVAQLSSAMTVLEKTNGPILMLGGDDDQVWPSCALIEVARKRLALHQHPFKDVTACFAGAGHSAGAVPGLPTYETAFYDPPLQALLNLGGSPAANAHAQREAWDRTVAFLASSL